MEQDQDIQDPIKEHVKELEKESWKHTDELEYLSDLSEPELQTLRELLFS